MPGSCTDSSATNKQGTLHVEVQLKESTNCDPFVRTDTIKKEVERWLLDNYKALAVGYSATAFRNLQCQSSVHSIKITGHSRPPTDETYHELAKQDMEIHVYSLAGDTEESTYEAQDGDDIITQFTVTQLPSKAFDGLWESLIYEGKMPDSLLRILTRTMKIVRLPQIDLNNLYWYNLILLHGPPGSGKTTLAQALAQKLAIRLDHMYSAARIVEINAHTLLSKWFGESGKLVGKLFDSIRSLAAEESLLIIVMIDEVETLASSREQASKGNECKDAIRATNELLQGLDKLRKRPNVVFICTSNLVENLDGAFMDRCGVKQFVGTPGQECVYEIFRSAINELIKGGLVVYDNFGSNKETALYEFSSDAAFNAQCDEGDDASTVISGRSSSPLPDMAPSDRLTAIPDVQYMRGYLWGQSHAAPCRLWRIASRAKGLSGRTLRRLPILALSKYTADEPCGLQELLSALKHVVNKEVAATNPTAPQEKRVSFAEELGFGLDGELV